MFSSVGAATVSGWPTCAGCARMISKGLSPCTNATATGILAVVRAGGDLTVMPSFFADRDPDLIRCLPPRPEDPNGPWLLTHERLRYVQRIRAMLVFWPRN